MDIKRGKHCEENVVGVCSRNYGIPGLVHVDWLQNCVQMVTILLCQHHIKSQHQMVIKRNQSDLRYHQLQRDLTTLHLIAPVRT